MSKNKTKVYMVMAASAFVASLISEFFGLPTIASTTMCATLIVLAMAENM